MFAGESLLFPLVRGVPVMASMRPRHVCRGKAHRTEARLRCSASFNEAPACLPGKARPDHLHLGPLDASMRPRHVCRGKRQRRSGGWIAHPGFNEAPACLPGKGSASPFAISPQTTASMRPRHVCRGKAKPTATGAGSGSRFNEAPACLPGKDPVFAHRKRSTSLLQ